MPAAAGVGRRLQFVPQANGSASRRGDTHGAVWARRGTGSLDPGRAGAPTLQAAPDILFAPDAVPTGDHNIAPRLRPAASVRRP